MSQNPQLWAVKPCGRITSDACCSLPTAWQWYKGKYILIDNVPQINGRPGTNPRIKCSICGFPFSGGRTRQKQHLRRIQGSGVQGCSVIEVEAP